MFLSIWITSLTMICLPRLAKQRTNLDEEEKAFGMYCAKFPEKKVTFRGEPFWNKSASKDLLAADVKSGLAYKMKPALLQASRKEYQEFCPLTFRKHIHQEKEKQRAAPYWRHKRNVDAMLEHAKERASNKDEWIQKKVKEDLGRIQSALSKNNRFRLL